VLYRGTCGAGSEKILLSLHKRRNGFGRPQPNLTQLRLFYPLCDRLQGGERTHGVDASRTIAASLAALADAAQNHLTQNARRWNPLILLPIVPRDDRNDELQGWDDKEPLPTFALRRPHTF
jgi:hypothetical protein